MAPRVPFQRDSWGSHLTQPLSSSVSGNSAPAWQPWEGSLSGDVPGESPEGATGVRRLLSRVDRFQEGPGEGVAPESQGHLSPRMRMLEGWRWGGGGGGEPGLEEEWGAGRTISAKSG